MFFLLSYFSVIRKIPLPHTFNRTFSVQALLDINDPEFACWYGHGVFWAMYGDYQGNGPYEDRYLIENISRNLGAGRYNSLSSPCFASVGFYLGMLHGGMLEPRTHQLRPSETLVVLTDPDFTEGYQIGRQAPFVLSDTLLMRTLHTYALSYTSEQTLSYELGNLIGTLSLRIIPATMPATAV